MVPTESLSMRAIFKVALPLMGIFMTSVLLVGNQQKAWAILPGIFIALYISAAEIRLKERQFYYRHFISWRRLPDDIADARCSILPALGYIRFRHFSPPFGILFFIVERGSGRFIPFQRTALMQRMLSALPMDKVRLPTSYPLKAARGSIGSDLLAPTLYPIAGLAFGMIVPMPWQNWTAPTGHDLLARILQLQQNSVILSLYVVVLAMLAIYHRRHGPASFAITFLIGTIVAHLARIH